MIRKSARRPPTRWDAIVVGAGAAGVGVGVALKDAGVENVLIIDRHEVGATFERWPKSMSFLTPSFPSNSVGILDLNAIALGSSPAFTTGQEHPDGPAYARYLRAVAEHFELRIQIGTDVQAVKWQGNRFVLETSQGVLRARHLVWAAGEFQYPHRSPFPGSQHCIHNSEIASFKRVTGDRVVVVGGYESGVDAAIQLAALGKSVTVLSRRAPWEARDSDPSLSLSVYTRGRLKTCLKAGGRIKFVKNAQVVGVDRKKGEYIVTAEDKRTWSTPSRPILATGFLGSHRLLQGLYEPRADDYPSLTEHDESSTTPGLYFCGPIVRHDEQVFCFIYKFRMRFAVVAKAIASSLGLQAEGLEQYRDWGMFLDDLSCCGEECVCAEEADEESSAIVDEAAP